MRRPDLEIELDRTNAEHAPRRRTRLREIDPRGDPGARLQGERMSKPKLAALGGELVPAEGAQLPVPRVARLDTARAVSRELARLYRAGRRGDVDPAVAARLAYTLNILIGSLKVSSLEERLDRLEQAADLARLPGPSGNGPVDYDASAEAEAADAAIIGDAQTAVESLK